MTDGALTALIILGGMGIVVVSICVIATFEDVVRRGRRRGR